MQYILPEISNKFFGLDWPNSNSQSNQHSPNLHSSYNDKESRRLANYQISKKEKPKSEFRSVSLNLVTGASLLSIVFALLTRGSKGLAQTTLDFAKKATQITFMTYGGFASAKAIGVKDTGLGLTQALEVAIPALTSDPCDLTMNRGFSIGLGNFVNEAKKYFSKSKYRSFSESTQYLAKSVGKFIDELKTNPIKTITNFDGPGAMIMGIVTASAPIVKHLLGLDKLSSLMRHFPGMAMELGKVNAGVLNKGASKYFSSGVFMLSSSLINLFSGFSKSKDTKQTIELGTWLLNVIGRKLLTESMNDNELASDKNNNAISPIVALKESLGSIFS